MSVVGGRAARVVGVGLCLAPLFVLTVRGWSVAALVLGVLCCPLLLAGPLRGQPGWREEDRRWVVAVLAMLVAPLLATAIGAALRRDFYAPQFDAPLRFALAVPIFLFMLRSRFDAARTLAWVLPAALLTTLATYLVAGQPARWIGEHERWATEVADPLVFGYLSLAFGLMCLVAITPQAWREGPRWAIAWFALGALLGLYLSVRSGSRSGWLALPLVLAFWLHLYLGRAHRWAWVGTLGLAMLAVAAAYLLLPRVQERIDLAVHEVLSYSFSGVAPGGSIPLRITFLRIAADLFALHPFAGVGDTAHLPPTASDVFPYASKEAVDTAYRAAFHNQVVTSAVRSGIAGGLAAAALLLVPLAVYVRQLRRGGAVARRNAALGLAFGLCLAVSSLSTEVVDLKYTASLYAVLTALLCGAALARHGQE